MTNILLNAKGVTPARSNEHTVKLPPGWKIITVHLLFTSTSSWKLTKKATAGFLECERKSITVSFFGLHFPT